MRKLAVLLAAATPIALLASPALAQLVDNTPPNNDDAMLKTQREIEAACTPTAPQSCEPLRSGTIQHPAARPREPDTETIKKYLNLSLRLRSLGSLF